MMMMAMMAQQGHFSMIVSVGDAIVNRKPRFPVARVPPSVLALFLIFVFDDYNRTHEVRTLPHDHGAHGPPPQKKQRQR
jgi:hypothetical protein